MQSFLKKRRKEWFDQRLHPGDPEPEPGAPGSIEQQLDMVEEGSLRGEQVLHEKNRPFPGELKARQGEPLAADELMALECYDLDLSEECREGAEMSGDEHSSGLQGGESELQGQPHLESGMPGAQTAHDEWFERHLHHLEDLS
ncbi:MAG: hypothetical protein ACK5QT_08930 [Oligoflexia bacterium]|jgi:hypothetical protein